MAYEIVKAESDEEVRQRLGLPAEDAEDDCDEKAQLHELQKAVDAVLRKVKQEQLVWNYADVVESLRRLREKQKKEAKSK